MQVVKVKRTVREICSLHAMGRLNLSPPWQRLGDLWSEEQERAFIDTLLRDLPVPAFYLNSVGDGFEVTDGQQRINTILKFRNGEFAMGRNLPSVDLDGVEYDVSGKKCAKLPHGLRERIEDSSLFVTMLHDTTEDQVCDIFARVNATSGISAYDLVRSLRGDAILFANGYGEGREGTRHPLMSMAKSPIMNGKLLIEFLLFAEKDGPRPVSIYNLRKFVLAHRDLDAALAEKVVETMDVVADLLVAAKVKLTFRNLRTLFQMMMGKPALKPIKRKLAIKWVETFFGRLADTEGMITTLGTNHASEKDEMATNYVCSGGNSHFADSIGHQSLRLGLMRADFEPNVMG